MWPGVFWVKAFWIGVFWHPVDGIVAPVVAKQRPLMIGMHPGSGRIG